MLGKNRFVCRNPQYLLREKLLNTESAWDRDSLSQADTVSSVPHSIDKDMVGELISKMNNGKAAGPSGLVQEMAAEEAGIGMISNLVNRICEVK